MKNSYDKLVVFVIELYDGTSYSTRFAVIGKNSKKEEIKKILQKIKLTGTEKQIKERIRNKFRNKEITVSDTICVLGPMRC